MQRTKSKERQTLKYLHVAMNSHKVYCDYVKSIILVKTNISRLKVPQNLGEIISGKMNIKKEDIWKNNN